MRPPEDRNSVLLELAENLLNAEGIDAAYDLLMSGIGLLHFSRARLYFCRTDGAGHMELVGAAHLGPDEEREHMIPRFEHRELVISPGMDNYGASMRCFSTGLATLFRLDSARTYNQVSLKDIDQLEVSRDCLFDPLLKDMVDTWLDLPICVKSIHAEDVPRAKVSIDKKGQHESGFQQEDIEVLLCLKRFAEIAIGNAEARESERIVSVAEQTISEAAARSDRVLEAVCEKILNEFIRLSHANGGHVRLYSPTRHTLVKISEVNDGGDLWPKEIPINAPVAGMAYVQQKPIIIDNASTSQTARKLRARMGADSPAHTAFFEHEKAFACFPLHSGRSCEGTISLTSNQQNSFAGKRYLLEHVAYAIAPRIGIWREFQEKTRKEEFSNLAKRVLNILDEHTHTQQNHIHAMLVALTSGHGLRYNNAVLLCRDLQSDEVVCRGAIGFASHSEAATKWSTTTVPEFGGSLAADVREYMHHAETIEQGPFPSMCIGARFQLSLAKGPLANVFRAPAASSIIPIRPEQCSEKCTCTALDQLGRDSHFACLVPIRFSGAVIAALYLDNVYTKNRDWEDLNKAQLLLQICNEVLGPTLVMDVVAAEEMRKDYAVSALVPRGLLLLDNEGVIRQSNRVFREMMGGDSRGASVLEMNSVRGKQIEADIRKALEGKRVDRNEVPFCSVYGRSASLDHKYRPIFMDGRFLGTLGIALDAGSASAALKQRIGSLVLGEIHDIAGSFARVHDALCELETVDLDSCNSDFVSRVHDANELFDQVYRRWERLRELGHYSYAVHVEAFELIELVRNVIAEVVRSRDITISVDQSQPCPPIYSDRNLLRLAIENVLANAINATEDIPNPRVEVTIDANELAFSNRVTIKVKDNGPGFPDSLLESLAPGSPIWKVATDAGFGLAITREIMQTIGGRLIVSSSSEPPCCEVLLQLPAL